MRGRKRRIGILVLMVACAVASLVRSGTASAGETALTLTNSVDSITPQDIQLIYDSMEATLIKRLRQGEKLDKGARTDLIRALGHMRSEKAIPYLLDSLEFTPWKNSLPDGHEVFVSRSTYEGTYPAVAALKRIGRLSSDRIVELISQSPEGSEREQILVSLGSSCDRKAFIISVRDQISKSSDKKPRWERILSFMRPD